MKDKTKGRLLKARGLIKKIVHWSPAFLIPAGMISCWVMLGLGLGQINSASKDFKETAIYSEAYSQEYEEAEQLYADGDINVYEYNKRMEHLESDDFTKEVLEQAGDAAKPFIEKKKIGIGVAAGCVGPAAVAIASVGLIFSPLGDSAEVDFDKAADLIAGFEPPKKKEELEDQEEESLPNIEDDYYRE